MLDLRKIVAQATTVAVIMENREKGETADLIEYSIKYKKPVCIDDCELTNVQKENGDKVWAFTVKEFPDKFFFAGFVMDKIFHEILKEAEGDLDMVYEAVRKINIKGIFSTKRTRDNHDVTDFKQV